MLYLFGFERIGVVVSDLYFLDPNPAVGQDGAERGVRLELRHLRAGEPPGSIYAARPIAIDAPIWRLDLLEAADGPPGTFNRTHHHPRFREWTPGPRVFARELSSDPLEWTRRRLLDVESLLDEAGCDLTDIGPHDADDLRAAVPDIVDCLQRTLAAVHAGELALAPAGDVTQARVSWL